MMRFGAILFAAAFSVQPLPQADGPLEPSVQNEVDHAIDMGERWLEKNVKVDKVSKVDREFKGNKVFKVDKEFNDSNDPKDLNDPNDPKDLNDPNNPKDLNDPNNPKHPNDLKPLNDLKAQLGLTNGQTRVDMALKLISSQRGGGWWLTDTNAAPTRLAVEILKGL